MIQLKSIAKNAPQFAALVEPDSNAQSDAELIADVERAGKAIICPYIGWTFTLAPPVTLTPDEFRRTWQGD